MISPFVLIILDGFGIAPPSRGNAITRAKKPFLEKLVNNFPVFLLQASGESVGLPWGEMGNSEVGHLNIGAGRIVYQELMRINRSIDNGSFYQNKAFLKAIENCKKNNSNLHIISLLSDGGVHSHIKHLYALLLLTKSKNIPAFLHLILDGRDAPYNSGIKYTKDILKFIQSSNIKAEICSISGRFYAMDRDKHWERIEKAYKAMTKAESEQKFCSAEDGIKFYYSKNIYDEEMPPFVIINENKNPINYIKDNDSVIFLNFRADRARQLTLAFISDDFKEFEIEKRPKVLFVAMTEYIKNIKCLVAFPTEILKNTISEVISSLGFYQLHIAETEKYAHVTYFFNGGKETPFDKEERIVVPSPRVISYDMKPEMSALEITDNVLKKINQQKYHFIVMNYANGDMVGHTGNLKATIKAIETIDNCLSKVIPEVLKFDGNLIITSDHGNSEEVIKLDTGEIDKEHSKYPVPCIIIGKKFQGLQTKIFKNFDLSSLQASGILADIAPTCLKIMGLETPKEMTGVALV